MENISVGGVFVSAVAAFVIGALWYSPLLFGKTWAALAGLSDTDLANANMKKTLGTGFALSLISALVFALFLGPNPAFGFAVGAGFSAGLFWVAAAFGLNYAFEQKPFKLFAINGGYHTIQFSVYGFVLGLI